MVHTVSKRTNRTKPISPAHDSDQRSVMNLDPQDPDARHSLYNALFDAMGYPMPSVPVNMGRKYYERGERALQEYRARMQEIANLAARYAAEDAT